MSKALLVYELKRVEGFEHRFTLEILHQSGIIRTGAMERLTVRTNVTYSMQEIRICSANMPSLGDLVDDKIIYLRGADTTGDSRIQQFDWGTNTDARLAKIQAALREWANHGGFCADSSPTQVPANCAERIEPVQWGIISLYQGLEYQI